MKLDKEMILKHRFWVMLLVVLPLALGALFILITSVSADISKTHADIVKDLETFAKFKKKGGNRTPSEIAEKELEAKIEKSKENVVWQQAWELQQDCFFWPDAMEKEFNFRSGLFAVKIQFLKGEVIPESPKDNNRLIHGEVIEQKGKYIKVEVTGKDKKDKKAQYKIFPSQKIDIEDKISFGQIKVGAKVAVTFNRGKYFNELLTDAELITLKTVNPDHRQDVYSSQILPLIQQVDPLTDKGEGVVQLLSNPPWFLEKDKKPPPLPPSYRDGAQSFLNFLDKGWIEKVSTDFSEEAWLAQQDLWIQSEMYRLIRLANDYVSKFELIEKKDKTYRFKNPYWELTLELDGQQHVSAILKNLLSRRQKQDVAFRIVFDEKLPSETIKISGEPLGPRGSKDDISKPHKKEIKPNAQGIFAVEQVLTWETAAVKRIDQISVGSQGSEDISHSHRTFIDGLDPLTPKKDTTTTPTNTGTGQTGGQTGRFTPGFGKGGGKKKVTRGAGANDLTEFHSLIRNQFWLFIDPNLPAGTTPPPAQFRRVPVALSLIVEQEHIDRVLTAFSNSKLRFLTTQVLTNRYPFSLQPQLPKDGNAGGVTGPPAAGKGRSSTASSANPDLLETNFEMVLYGIVTLYERYPAAITAGP